MALGGGLVWKLFPRAGIIINVGPSSMEMCISPARGVHFSQNRSFRLHEACILGSPRAPNVDLGGGC